MNADPEDFLIRVASSRVDREESPSEEVDILAENARLRERVEVAERRAGEYFGLVERVLKQRDDWKDLHETAVHERAAALMMQERHILTLRQWCAKAIHLLNEARKKEGLEPIAAPEDLEPVDGPPVGAAEAYWERQKALARELRMGLVDALAEREAIAARRG